MNNILPGIGIFLIIFILFPIWIYMITSLVSTAWHSNKIRIINQNTKDLMKGIFSNGKSKENKKGQKSFH